MIPVARYVVWYCTTVLLYHCELCCTIGKTQDSDGHFDVRLLLKLPVVCRDEWIHSKQVLKKYYLMLQSVRWE